MFTPFVYQDACLRSIEAERQRGAKKALIVMASGLGKTVTMAFDARAWAQHHKGRFLYLCHQNDILYQAKSTFQTLLGNDYTYGYFHGQEKSPHGVDFLFASLQTMETYRELFDRHEFAYIVVDESHHAQAPTFRSTIEYFRPQFLLGTTATPDRLDELDIREVFGDEIFSLPLEEAMAKGYLAPVDYRIVTDEIQLSRAIETEKGKMSISYLNRKIFIPRRDEEIARIIERYVAEVRSPKTILFCNSIRHCEHLSNFVPDSFSIHSRIPGKERGVRLEMFRQGIIDTVLTVDCFNEGIDVPESNVVVFLRSTSSKTIFFQQLGRGLRRAEGKEKVVVLDFVANCERIKMVNELQKDVEKHLTAIRAEEGSKDRVEPMTLNINSVEFQEKILPILDVLARINPNYYPTWQEASEGAIRLGFSSSKSYRKSFRDDPRLPPDPSAKYKDFPGWVPFLGKDARDLYETWQEASQAVGKLGIRRAEYRSRYQEDQRLPSSPQTFYENFPGWGQFSGDWRVRVRSVDTYLTWIEAGKAAVALGVKGKVTYRELYKKDSQLPASPSSRYQDFPGWPKFLGKED